MYNFIILLAGLNDFFSDPFDDLVYGDIDEKTRNDEAINHNHVEDDIDVTKFKHNYDGFSHVFNPLGRLDSGYSSSHDLFQKNPLATKKETP